MIIGHLCIYVSLCRMAGELESDSVALERIREYEDLPQENDWDTKGGIDKVNPLTYSRI